MKAVVPVVTVVLIISILSSGIGCARPVPSPAPPPATGTAKPPSPAAKAPPGAPAVAKGESLAQIIEGAKKEGAVSATTISSYTPAPIVQAMRNNIREKYGVDLNIKMSGSEGYGNMVAQAVMEHRTGIPPTYDLLGLTDQFLALAAKEDILVKMDWRPLLPAGTPAEVIPSHPSLAGSVVLLGTSTGLMYNTSKVAADQVPKTLQALADPKWKGKLGVMNYETHWTRWAYVLGKEKTVATLREILKIKPILGNMNGLNNRYLLGEIDLAFMSSAYILQNNQAKNVPTAYRALDYLDARNSYLSVAKSAQHPNAAKLLAIYLASADGVKFSVEKAEVGHFFYPGNYVYDIVLQAKKEGVPMHATDTYPGLLEFLTSPEAGAWEKEIGLIIKGG